MRESFDGEWIFTSGPDRVAEMYTLNAEQQSPLHFSDDEQNFPTSKGWMKMIINAKRYSYIRLKSDGIIQIEYFEKGLKGKYNNVVDNYCCSGQSIPNGMLQ